MSGKLCSIEGCGRRAIARGWCEMHWARWRRTGSPLGRPQQSLEGRFWSKVDRNGDCWEWKASRTAAGYGRFGVSRRVWEFAHRVAWRLTHGEIPAGAFVCHRCDNPACVRPEHLFLGSPADNSADMKQKGRGKGNPHPGPRKGMKRLGARKLSDAQIQEIRALYGAKQVTQKELALRYGVSQPLISLVVRGESYMEGET